MINQVFGKWTVVSEVEIKRIKNRNIKFYTCKCTCGTVNPVRSYQLRTGKSLQCAECNKNKIDVNSYIGKKIGKWKVIEEASIKKHGSTTVLCECECGTKLIFRAYTLKNLSSKQCNKCRQEENISRLTKHGRAYDSVYTTWQQAKKRCTNPKDKDWDNYGGRGIRMCDRWINSFECFIEDMGDRPHGLQIDRIDNDGNYEPGNCHWVTPKENHDNRRCSKKNKVSKDQLTIASRD